jgi:hypothetical protein
LHDGTQLVPLHEVLPWAFEHATPHAPQFVVVVVAVSQPLFALPSQLPQPALQPGAQSPLPHATVPWLLLHCVPHAPQLLVLVKRFVSQPLFGLPSQLPKPALHAGEQLPATQDVEPFELVHAVPQVPQLVVVVRLVSQPSLALALQLPQPPLQLMEHAPSEHVGTPFALLQALPQLPQLPMLVWVLISQPLFGLPSQLA